MRQTSQAFRVALAVGFCWLATFATLTMAQDYPARSVTLVVPFPPGGVADNVARPVSVALGKQLGQSVVIENKSGAGNRGGCGQRNQSSVNAAAISSVHRNHRRMEIFLFTHPSPPAFHCLREPWCRDHTCSRQRREAA